MRILVIDPGASTTKIGIWEENDLRIRETIPHTRDVINQFERIADQEEMRFSAVEKLLEDKHYLEATFDAVVGRGGLIKPVEGGTYEVDDTMVDDLRKGANGEHASNLGDCLPTGLPSITGFGLLSSTRLWWMSCSLMQDCRE